MSNTNSNFEKIIKSNRKSNEEFTTKGNSWKATQKRGYGSKRYAGWENN